MTVVIRVGLLWTSKEIIEYFESFGLSCPKEAIKVSNRLNLNCVYNSTQYQDFFSVFCGYNCLYYMNVHNMGTTCNSDVEVFSTTDYASDEKFIKQYFIMVIFTGDHSKIDTTKEDVEGPAG